MTLLAAARFPLAFFAETYPYLFYTGDAGTVMKLQTNPSGSAKDMYTIFTDGPRAFPSIYKAGSPEESYMFFPPYGYDKTIEDSLSPSLLLTPEGLPRCLTYKEALEIGIIEDTVLIFTDSMVTKASRFEPVRMKCYNTDRTCIALAGDEYYAFKCLELLDQVFDYLPTDGEEASLEIAKSLFANWDNHCKANVAFFVAIIDSLNHKCGLYKMMSPLFRPEPVNTIETIGGKVPKKLNDTFVRNFHEILGKDLETYPMYPHSNALRMAFYLAFSKTVSAELDPTVGGLIQGFLVSETRGIESVAHSVKNTDSNQWVSTVPDSRGWKQKDTDGNILQKASPPDFEPDH